MLKKVLTILLMCLVTNVAGFADGTKEEKDFAGKVKTEITKLGTGTDAKVKVKLKDGTKLKGYVSEIKADSFVVINETTGTANEVSYSKAKQVKGNNLSNGAKIAIAIAGIVGLTILLIVAGRN
jgi:small nuclear ribonucleoprotein (snRNP)-like protein